MGSSPLPYVRNYRIRLLPRVFGVKANAGVWMDQAWARQPPTLQPVEPLPCPAALGFVTAPTNDPEPQSAYLGIEFAGRFHVAGHRMVIREPTNHTCQPYSGVLQRVVHPSDQLRFYLFQFPAKARRDGLAADTKFPPPGNSANMRET